MNKKQEAILKLQIKIRLFQGKSERCRKFREDDRKRFFSVMREASEAVTSEAPLLKN